MESIRRQEKWQNEMTHQLNKLENKLHKLYYDKTWIFDDQGIGRHKDWVKSQFKAGRDQSGETCACGWRAWAKGSVT